MTIEEQIAAAVVKLPRRLRKVFVMATTQRKTYAAIAAELGMSVRAVERAHTKALKGCRDRLPALDHMEQKRCGSRS